MKKKTPLPSASTKDKVIWTCIELMQRESFDAIGMRDIAATSKIQAASLYYHFTSKDDLAAAAMEAYRMKQSVELERLDGVSGLGPKLSGYVDLYTNMLSDGRRCFCLLLLGKQSGMSAKTLKEVGKFIDQNVSWLAKTLETSKRGSTPQKTVARVIFSALEGMMILASAEKNPAGAFKLQAGSLLAALQLDK